jgi:hypothetical protein
MLGECFLSDELEMFLELSPDPKLVCDCRRLLAKLSGVDCRLIGLSFNSSNRLVCKDDQAATKWFPPSPLTYWAVGV